jgi:hypothetical protein
MLRFLRAVLARPTPARDVLTKVLTSRGATPPVTVTVRQYRARRRTGAALVSASMDKELVCWRCGAALASLTLPLRRQEECPVCGIHLHVCRLCVNFDRARPKQCREDDAEEVRDKERANFCDYFAPRPAAFDASGVAADARARSGLDALFGGSGPCLAGGGDPAAAAAEALFGKGKRK